MKDMFFSIAMLLAGVFCAIVGMEYALVLYLGGLFAVIGVVVALVAEFGGGLVKNPDDEKDYGIADLDLTQRKPSFSFPNKGKFPKGN